MTDTKPGDRPRHAEDDRAAHAAELEKRDGGATADGVPELRPPAGITVGGETANVVLWRRREGVIVGFCIRRIRVVEVGVERLAATGGEVDAHVVSGVDVLEGVEGVVSMSSNRLD